MEEPVSAGQPPFDILRPGVAARPIVVHLPHAGTAIPPEVREGLLLSDDDLDREIVRLTDWHTDRLFAWGLDVGSHADRQPALAPGRGSRSASWTMPWSRWPASARAWCTPAAPTGSRSGARSAAGRRALIDRWYEPYHAALTALVASNVDRFDGCLIIDGHSFATVPLPSEADQRPDRPDVCIGSDAFHTPADLVDGLVTAFEAEGLRVAVNWPFAGSLVPAAWYGRDDRVRSVMIEVRRGLYCDEATGEAGPALDAVAASIATAVRRAIGLTDEGSPNRAV